PHLHTHIWHSLVLHYPSMSNSLFIALHFFFTEPSPTEIYTLSLHDALPILKKYTPDRNAENWSRYGPNRSHTGRPLQRTSHAHEDRKSTRLNSSHQIISYAVFCLKKKKIQ